MSEVDTLYAIEIIGIAPYPQSADECFESLIEHCILVLNEQDLLTFLHV